MPFLLFHLYHFIQEGVHKTLRLGGVLGMFLFPTHGSSPFPLQSDAIIDMQGHAVNPAECISVTIRFDGSKKEPGSHRLKECIRVRTIKNLVCPHHRDEILCLRQIDYVVSVSWKHVNCLDLFSAHFKFDHFICTDLPFLNQAVTGNNDKELPLSVMPMLSFCDPRLGDVYAELSMIGCLQQLSK